MISRSCFSSSERNEKEAHQILYNMLALRQLLALAKHYLDNLKSLPYSLIDFAITFVGEKARQSACGPLLH